MPTTTDWMTAWAAITADGLSLTAGLIALKAVHWSRRAAEENKRAADEAKRSADAAASQVRLMRPRPLVLAGYLGGHDSRPGFCIRNIGTGTAFDIEISDLALANGPAISTNSLPYLEVGTVEPGIHRFLNTGLWSQAASGINESDLQMFVAYFAHKIYNPDGSLILPVFIRYRSATGEPFQTDLELRVDKKLNVVRLFPRDSLIGVVPKAEVSFP